MELPQDHTGAVEKVLLSSLNDYLFCPRLCIPNATGAD